ncbi:short integuments 2, mitochondrial-like isoform X2 [Actinidia eriantha]|uniref:short integuments 2, mitochondrial-like isoform X2 n=1 Tax=Actinidia eriantha TaxID=165200 RepID=UPI002584D961|nr:short integuments 2, mitochondrial-like isoform X2 [Actinidia eriantha]
MRFNLEGGAINWFPGHMGAATRAIGDRLKLSDIVIEVHDVRVYPPRRPHSNLLCKHKSPTNAHRQKKWIHYFHSHNQDCLSINAHNKDSVKKEKLKRATVGPLPGVTQYIEGYKEGIFSGNDWKGEI